MITSRSLVRAIERDSFYTSPHAVRRAIERVVDLEQAVASFPIRSVTNFYEQGSWVIASPRLVTVVRCGGETISLVWGDGFGSITLITVHRGSPHNELDIAHSDYYYRLADCVSRVA